MDDKHWDSDDSVCLMEDMSKEKAREMVLMKSMRVKPKLMKMGEDALMMGKDSAMGRARCVPGSLQHHCVFVVGGGLCARTNDWSSMLR